MQEPAYILKNGQSIPYIPVGVNTARDAYAASLHVLFKHVADFHICVVRVFSAKYGIPEDDILKTIQESDEFKNMKVDPVRDMGVDSLGYLNEAPVSKEEAPVSKEEVKKVKSTKVKKMNNPDSEPVVIIAEELREYRESRPDPVPEHEPSTIKIKTIRKKIVVPNSATSPATTAPATTAPATTAPVTTAPVTTAPATTAPATTTIHALAISPEKKVHRKIIKKNL